MKKILSKLKDEKGQSAVEFALVGTLLLVLSFRYNRIRQGMVQGGLA